jgi:hypothetical protein
MKVQAPFDFVTGCRAVGSLDESLRHNMVSDVCWDTMAMKHFYSWHDAPTQNSRTGKSRALSPEKRSKVGYCLSNIQKRGQRVKGTAQQVHL